ncbi:ABC transporter substrate-binding protein [Salmonella enterica subsp. enterica serovar Minnesota]|nr:ABC transporter substrate-binding protein [Salmonella enterica subsp. enterica serovar Minnesota]
MSGKACLLFIILPIISPSAVYAVQEVIRVGADLTNPPFQSKDKNGYPSGFDIDVTNALCRSINARCDYVVNTFDAQIPSLLSRKTDIILPLGATEKRRNSIDFSHYVFHDPTRLVTRKNSHLLPRADMLKGKSIAVLQGSIQEIYANKYWLSAGVEVKNYQDQDAIYQDLYTGRVDGALCPSAELIAGFLQTPEGKNFELKGPEITDTELFSIGSAYGIRKNDIKTKQLINRGLDNIMNDGTYSAIEKKYFGDLNISIKGK